MDAATSRIRYQRWVQVIQDWSNSGLSKRDYCQQNAINEKRFYYHQHRIRVTIATRAERPALLESNSRLAANSVGQQSNRLQIVNLQFSGMAQANTAMISFSVNGMNFSVPESIPASLQNSWRRRTMVLTEVKVDNIYIVRGYTDMRKHLDMIIII